jgi:hypothetical protein
MKFKANDWNGILLGIKTKMLPKLLEKAAQLAFPDRQLSPEMSEAFRISDLGGCIKLLKKMEEDPGKYGLDAGFQWPPEVKHALSLAERLPE